jgi:hypothetical protein
LAQTSPTSGGRSVGIVRLPTEAMEFFFPLVTLAWFHKLLRLVMFIALLDSIITKDQLGKMQKKAVMTFLEAILRHLITETQNSSLNSDGSYLTELQPS